MIWESSYWKEDLLRHAAALRKRTQQHRWPDRSLARLEQTVMLGFYSIRKLLEAKKLTVDVSEKQLPVISFPSLGKPVTLLNWHHLDRLYDFDHPNEQKRSIQWLCNQVVHSYVFTPTFAEPVGLTGLLLNSDRTRHEALYLINIEDIISLFYSVGADNANYAEKFRLDPKKGDFEVVLRNISEDERDPNFRHTEDG